MTLMEYIHDELGKVTDREIELTGQDMDPVEEGETRVLVLTEYRYLSALFTLVRLHSAKSLVIAKAITATVLIDDMDMLVESYARQQLIAKFLNAYAWAEVEYLVDDPDKWARGLSVRQGWQLVMDTKPAEPERSAMMVPIPARIGELLMRLAKTAVHDGEEDEDQKKQPPESKPH